MQLFNIKRNKAVRRILRNKMTSAEDKLWQELRRKQLGYKFRRQFGIGSFIVDFYCPKLKFAIELDGDSHATDLAQEKDKYREKFLNDCGIIVKRYWNNEIFENIDSVLEEIYNVCKELETRKVRGLKEGLDSPSKIRERYRGI